MSDVSLDQFASPSSYTQIDWDTALALFEAAQNPPPPCSDRGFPHYDYTLLCYDYGERMAINEVRMDHAFMSRPFVVKFWFTFHSRASAIRRVESATMFSPLRDFSPSELTHVEVRATTVFGTGKRPSESETERKARIIHEIRQERMGT